MPQQLGLCPDQYPITRFLRCQRRLPPHCSVCRSFFSICKSTARRAVLLHMIGNSLKQQMPCFHRLCLLYRRVDRAARPSDWPRSMFSKRRTSGAVYAVLYLFAQLPRIFVTGHNIRKGVADPYGRS